MWKPDLADCLIDISLDDKDHVVVITTHTTFSSNNFIQILKNKGNYPVFLIADEVHGLGAEISLNGLTDVYDYRLGLSATPKDGLMKKVQKPFIIILMMLFTSSAFKKLLLN